MSDTPKLADECKKLLDNGHLIVMFSNGLGSYTAQSYSHGNWPVEIYEGEPCHITDDFEPSHALYRLTEKVFGNIV